MRTAQCEIRISRRDAQEAAAIEQIACPQAASRQPSDKQRLLPPVPLSLSLLLPLWSCVVGVRN